jgi:Zn-finger nucleic acid-binding protein
MVRMVDAAQPHIWVESCPVCHGTFFDAGEFTDFKEHRIGEILRGERRERAP